MIQFNLLPDVKIDYVKAERVKRLTFLVAFIVTCVAAAIFLILLFITEGVQRQQMKSVDKSISTNTSTLKSIDGIDKILTVQNQLKTVKDLHFDKPVASRLQNYITQVTPVNISIASIDVDFDNKTIEINGTADKLQTVNKFTDTLKFTTFKKAGSDTTNNAFKPVVAKTLSRDDKNATFNLSLTYDPALFDYATDVTLNVPQNLITTRSYTEQPTNNLFKSLPQINQSGQSQ